MTKIKIFDLKDQYKTIAKEINKNVTNILSSGQYILGNNVKLLEENFAKHVGAKYAISCNSGTDALLLSLRALGIGKGDEVITTPFTYFATAEVIALVGAKPIFADINPHTFNINHKLIESLISKKTKAIMPVHIYGQSCRLDEIIQIAKLKKLYVIEDAAEALGGVYKGKKIGLSGDCVCFSFFANKIITTGEGGMILIKKKKNYIKLYNNGFVKHYICKKQQKHTTTEKKKRSHSLLQTLRTCYLGQFGVLISEVFTILSQTPVLGFKT